MKIFRISLQKLVGSRYAVGFAIWLCKVLPTWFAYPLGSLIARIITLNRKSEMARAVRANQWVVSGYTRSKKELNRIVFETFRTNIGCLYDYYHNIGDAQKVREMVTFDASFTALFPQGLEQTFPALFVMPHLSNFDLAGRALALAGLKFQVLSYPQPPSGYQLANQIRAVEGMEVTPMSLNAVRQARARLHAGGIVLTGVDRPLEDTHYFPRFFNRPAHVPVGYIQLALQTRVPVYVVACIQVKPGKYSVVARPVVYMQPDPDRTNELEKNAEAVLREAEALISAYPKQWAMFYSVWPEVQAEMP